MGSKRAAAGEAGPDVAKRRREHAPFKPARMNGSAIDQTYGQRGAFGDLKQVDTTAPTGESDLDCEDDTEALAYLRSVRVQAYAIPHVLVAKKAGPQRPPHTADIVDGPSVKEEDDESDTADRNSYQDGAGDFRGFYHDGAYTALPADYFDEDNDEEYYEESQDGEVDTQGQEAMDYFEEESLDSSDDNSHNSSADEIRDAYFTSLTKKYLDLRQVLQTDPSASALSSLPASNPTEVGNFSRQSDTFTRWSRSLWSTDPLPTQIAGMRKVGALRLLRIILGGKFLRKKRPLHERTSRWIWALLARLPEKGVLDYEEIGWIRELGKRAVLLMASLAELEILKEHYEVGDASSHGSRDKGDYEDTNEELHHDTPEDDDEFDSDEADLNDGAKSPVVIQGGSSAMAEVTVTKETVSISVDSEERVTTTQTTHTQQITDDHACVQNKVQPTNTSTHPASGATLDESSDVEMQLDSDMEDGEIPPSPPTSDLPVADGIEAAKARLLAQLNDDAGATGDQDEDATPIVLEVVIPTPEPTEEERKKQEETAQKQREKDRAKVNERATLNMILTVVGEFYGQRDLLEFRDPFGGVSD
ncbi:Uu.00g113920.m01.CDS01 [Anthostomella pinea]|uniref:Uu.00g113920.m01.CDS01 n=1 Tax=Anthostomella pinea TaxID=933095 RepID=A0AAI8VFG3_9PEZI|nr:Uu.00g113920.m01.CDS01 [Anthostomella pinea]